MRWFTVLIFTLLMITPVMGVRHVEYSKAVQSDEYIHSFFSDILKDVGKCFDLFLDESDALNKSISIVDTVKLVREEYEFYSGKGVKSNVSVVLSPFVNLSNYVYKLCKAQSVFLENIGKDYVKSRLAVEEMKFAVDEIEKSLDEIDEIVLWNGSSNVSFDTSPLRSKLKDVRELIEYYDGMLIEVEKKELPFAFVVTVSNTHPFVYENITIRIYAVNVTPKFLYIDSKRFDAKGIMVYRFNETGKHVIYAVGLHNEKTVKSNVVNVIVSKIPTYVILKPSKRSAFIGNSVNVRGWVVDYYGKLVNGNLTVIVDGKSYTFQNQFEINVTRQNEGCVNITALYNGSDIYRQSSASISIYFSRYPVTLRIYADRSAVNIGDTVKFTGTISISDAVVQIFVNSTLVKSINASGVFNFTLDFQKEGNYVVYAYYAGNDTYKPAKSNYVAIEVKRGFNPMLILLAVPIVALVYFLSKRVKVDSKRLETKPEVKKERREVYVEIEEEKREIPKDIRNAYNLLFEVLTTKYKLKKSLTPRELLNTLKDKPFAELLRTVTTIHEKAVYAEVELSDEERKAYFNAIEQIFKVIE